MTNVFIVLRVIALNASYCYGYNFFSDWNHCTRAGNVESTILPLLSGVIQGIGIGPIMFVIYINE